MIVDQAEAEAVSVSNDKAVINNHVGKLKIQKSEVKQEFPNVPFLYLACHSS